MNHLDDGDLALIEKNDPSPLVHRLIWKIRALQDELLATQVDCDAKRDELDDLRDALDAYET